MSVIVAIDVETTGLEPDQHHILEVALVLLDHDLNILDQGEWVLTSDLQGIDPWCLEVHGKSGLLDEVAASSLTASQVLDQMLAMIAPYDTSKAPLMGNSVHFDRRFLERDFKPFLAKIGHRHIDVSSLRLCSTYWRPEALPPEVEVPHRAMGDIITAVGHLRHYKHLLFA